VLLGEMLEVSGETWAMDSCWYCLFLVEGSISTLSIWRLMAICYCVYFPVKTEKTLRLTPSLTWAAFQYCSYSVNLGRKKFT
jgi:hypothetical protein